MHPIHKEPGATNELAIVTVMMMLLTRKSSICRVFDNICIIPRLNLQHIKREQVRRASRVPSLSRHILLYCDQFVICKFHEVSVISSTYPRNCEPGKFIKFTSGCRDISEASFMPHVGVFSVVYFSCKRLNMTRKCKSDIYDVKVPVDNQKANSKLQ